VHSEMEKGMEYSASRYLHTLCAIPVFTLKYLISLRKPLLFL
jgi:hypothetical protein